MHLPTQSSKHSRKPANSDIVRTVTAMGTVVTIHLVGRAAGLGGAEPPPAQELRDRTHAVERAFGWFLEIQERCTRFNPESELMRLCVNVGVPVPVSEILFELVGFAVAVAEQSGGAFDPTVGYAMENLGFNREFSSGTTVRTSSFPRAACSYKDVCLDVTRHTITLLRPLVLDLGAVAKGLAIDLAARELSAFEDFAINAGGDLYLGGRNPNGEPWSIGIRHPRRPEEVIDRIRVSNQAVCTSGDYERRISGSGHHILDPNTGASADQVASVTTIAPNAMLADAVATAAFVLGPAGGIQLLDRLGVDGVIISPTLERYSTRGMNGACH